MALTKKQPGTAAKKNEGGKGPVKNLPLKKGEANPAERPGKKPVEPKGEQKNIIGRAVAVFGGKKGTPGKEVSKKETAKRDLLAKKERVNYVEEVRKFLRSSYNEMKKVHWPTRKETVVYTSVVLVAVAAVGVLIWLFDSALSALLRLILVK
jgi:preprotein translocase subunit SecE